MFRGERTGAALKLFSAEQLRSQRRLSRCDDSRRMPID